jgi:SAM-dependent methyltransferase
MPEQILLKFEMPIEMADIKLAAVACPICDENPQNYYGRILFNDTEWKIDYCTNCHLWWVNPRPEENFYNILYEKYFYKSPMPEQFGYASVEVDSGRRTEKAKKNWDDIEPYIETVPHENFLEIGCATGELLIEAKARGWQRNIGVEIDVECAEIAKQRGLDVFVSTFENIHDFGGRFNLIFADNVFEHFLDPMLVVRQCYAIQEPNGCLILRLPDTGKEGPRLKLIDHTFHFTRTSITKILQKSGYHVNEIFHSGTYHSSDKQNKIENMTVVATKTDS